LTLFLDLATFTTMYGQSLTAAQQAEATLLLTVVDSRIRELCAAVSVTPDPSDAERVCFEVVRSAIYFGALADLSSFDDMTSRRREAGEFDAAAKAVNDYLTVKHKRLLGIPVLAAPAGSFRPHDFGPCWR
jgi:hypothetical protein